MDITQDTVSLDTLAGGGVMERFDDELRAVIKNCLDPNTADGARTITLTVKVKPDAQRSRCDVTAIVASKTLPAAALSTSMFIGMDPILGAVAYEHNPKQLNLFKAPEPGANVVSFADALNNQQAATK